MIRMLREVEGKIEEANDLSLPGMWIQLIAPTAEELHQVALGTGLLLDFLAAALDPEERPRQDVEGDQTLVIIDVPAQRSDTEIRTLPLGVVINPNAIVSVCLEENPVFLLRPRLGVHPGKKTRLLLQLLYRSADLYLESIKKLNVRAGLVEKTLRRSMKNEQMFQLMEIQKSLVYLSIAVKANEILLEELLSSCLRPTEERRNLAIPIQLFPEDEDLLEDALTEYRQAISTAEIHSGILTATLGAFASIISNNLNIVMKFLAAVTIIIAFPTMIASLFGMNVNLPFQNHPWAFIGILGLAVLASLFALWLLRRWRMF